VFYRTLALKNKNQFFFSKKGGESLWKISLGYSVLYKVQRDLYSMISQSFSNTNFPCEFPREGHSLLHFQKLFDDVPLLPGTGYSNSIP